MVEFKLLDFANAEVFKKFEEEFDKDKRIRTFLEGVFQGICMFIPEDDEVYFFEPSNCKVGDYWVMFFYKFPDKGEHWENVWVSIEKIESEMYNEYI